MKCYENAIPVLLDIIDQRRDWRDIEQIVKIHRVSLELALESVLLHPHVQRDYFDLLGRRLPYIVGSGLITENQCDRVLAQGLSSLSNKCLGMLSLNPLGLKDISLRIAESFHVVDEVQESVWVEREFWHGGQYAQELQDARDLIASLPETDGMAYSVSKSFEVRKLVEQLAIERLGNLPDKEFADIVADLEGKNEALKSCSNQCESKALGRHLFNRLDREFHKALGTIYFEHEEKTEVSREQFDMALRFIGYHSEGGAGMREDDKTTRDRVCLEHAEVLGHLQKPIPCIDEAIKASIRHNSESRGRSYPSVYESQAASNYVYFDTLSRGDIVCVISAGSMPIELNDKLWPSIAEPVGGAVARGARLLFLFNERGVSGNSSDRKEIECALNGTRERISAEQDIDNQVVTERVRMMNLSDKPLFEWVSEVPTFGYTRYRNGLELFTRRAPLFQDPYEGWPQITKVKLDDPSRLRFLAVLHHALLDYLEGDKRDIHDLTIIRDLIGDFDFEYSSNQHI